MESQGLSQSLARAAKAEESLLPLADSMAAVTLGVTNPKKKKKHPPPANMWNYLPREVGRVVCLLLGDVDMLGYLLCVSREWVIFGDEKIYEEVASRVYLSQTDKKLLNVSKWGSWREMLVYRPRIRTNGFYSLRTSYFKPPCNDAFWEEKKYEYTEVRLRQHELLLQQGLYCLLKCALRVSLPFWITDC